MMAAAVVVAAILGGVRGFPGPGATMLLIHIPAAVVAVGAQYYADHRAGWSAMVSSLAPVAATVVVLCMVWVG
jgi:hypothetical protein